MCTAEALRTERGFSSSLRARCASAVRVRDVHRGDAEDAEGFGLSLCALCASAVRFRNVHRGGAEDAEMLQLVSLRALCLGGISQVTPKLSIPSKLAVL